MNYEQGIEPALLDKLYDICVAMDSLGNRGWYTGYLPATHYQDSAADTIIARKFIEYRRGLIFYSTGHGWRVRKNPHWRGVFEQRFPLAYARGAEREALRVQENDIPF